MKESAQDQIFKIVFANPGINQNGIWRKSENITAKSTLEKNLKYMIKNKLLIVKKDPLHSQKKLFYVNSEMANFLYDIDNKIDLVDNALMKNQNLVYDFLTTKDLKNSKKLTKKLIDIFSSLINDLLDLGNASLVYQLMGSEMLFRKANSRYIKHTLRLRKSLKLLRKKNPTAFLDLMAFVVYKLEIPF